MLAIYTIFTDLTTTSGSVKSWESRNGGEGAASRNPETYIHTSGKAGQQFASRVYTPYRHRPVRADPRTLSRGSGSCCSLTARDSRKHQNYLPAIAIATRTESNRIEPPKVVYCSRFSLPTGAGAVDMATPRCVLMASYTTKNTALDVPT